MKLLLSQIESNDSTISITDEPIKLQFKLPNGKKSTEIFQLHSNFLNIAMFVAEKLIENEYSETKRFDMLLNYPKLSLIQLFKEKTMKLNEIVSLKSLDIKTNTTIMIHLIE